MTQEKATTPQNEPPMVSVIIPTYNAANYIAETLDSVFAQTFSDCEVLVVNDGSPDTPELEVVLRQYQDQIVYIRQDNLGPSAARNTGIRHARGQYMAFLDSDDLWMPEFLANLLQFLEQHPAVDMVCADCVYFGDPQWDGTSWQSLHPLDDPITFDKILPTLGGAFASFALLRKEIVSKAGFFDEKLRILEDYQYWLRLLHRSGKLVYVRNVLGKRRIHRESLTYNRDVVLSNAVQALASLDAHLAPGSREAVLVQRELAFVSSRFALREGRRKLASREYRGASEFFREANGAVPSRKVRLVLMGLRLFPRWTRWAVSRWDQRAEV